MGRSLFPYPCTTPVSRPAREFAPVSHRSGRVNLSPPHRTAPGPRFAISWWLPTRLHHRRRNRQQHAALLSIGPLGFVSRRCAPSRIVQLEREDRTEEDKHYFLVLPCQFWFSHVSAIPPIRATIRPRNMPVPRSDVWAISHAVVNAKNSIPRYRISPTSPNWLATPKNVL